MKHTACYTALALLAMLPPCAMAQDYYQQGEPPPPYADGAPVPPPDGTPPPQAMQQPQGTFSQEQIEQLVAPIALYPDALMGQILMASTYPLEVVQADRWRQENPGLQGGQLAAAIANLPWDPSVKSLAAFPQILSMMDKNLQWTEQLGNAFLAQQPAVMDSVQHLRGMAQSAGHLVSTPQQTVATEGNYITIAPANPEIVYVPVYNPVVVYGPWPYPTYQPYYFPPPPRYHYAGAGIIAFGLGITVATELWGWDHWDWHRHRIDIDDRRYEELNRNRPPPVSGYWQHDPAHRDGVPYHNAAVRAQFQGAHPDNRSDFRGYAPQANNRPNNEARRSPVQPQAQSRTDAIDRAQRLRQQPPTFDESHEQPTPRAQVQPQAQHQQRPQSGQGATSPMFESFSRGQDVRTQAQRGSNSLATSPARSYHNHPNAPTAAPVAQPRQQPQTQPVTQPHVQAVPQQQRIPTVGDAQHQHAQPQATHQDNGHQYGGRPPSGGRHGGDEDNGGGEHHDNR